MQISNPAAYYLPVPGGNLKCQSLPNKNRIQITHQARKEPLRRSQQGHPGPAQARHRDEAASREAGEQRQSAKAPKTHSANALPVLGVASGKKRACDSRCCQQIRGDCDKVCKARWRGVSAAHDVRRRELPLRRHGSQAVQSRDSRRKKEIQCQGDEPGEAGYTAPP